MNALAHLPEREKSPNQRIHSIMAIAGASAVKRGAVDLLDPRHSVGLQSLLTRVYNKPVELQLVKLRRPHLDVDILSAHITQKLADRRLQPRKVIREAAWKSNLPTDRAVTELQQAKKQAPTMVSSPAVEKSSAFGPLRPETAEILRKLKLSQVMSIRVEAAGRLTKRMTANRSQRKSARRGGNGKGPGYMTRGFRKGHVQVSQRHGKRRVGSYGVRVDLGHC